MNLRIIVIGFALIALTGCSTDAVDKETKRSQDRMAIRLSQAESQRDQYKAQAEKLQAQLDDMRKASEDSSQQVALLRKQVQELQNTNVSLSSEIERLKIDLSRADVAKTPQTK